MIRTKFIVDYGDRSELSGIIMIEVVPILQTPESTTFLVNDWDLTKEMKDPINSKQVIWYKQEIDTMDAYLEQNNDFSMLGKTEREFKKMQLALLIDTQFNLFNSGLTIYRLNPDDWEIITDDKQ
jgi:hypothetical protein